ncbi:MAG: hypothetical protein PVI57_11420 [Gemmatimonadota bacterium]|jgi:hypothetical protein
MLESAKPLTLALLLALLPPWATSASAQGDSGPDVRVDVGILTGFASGASLQLFGSVRDFSDQLPVEVRLRLGYTRNDPGDPARARRIFINNATNGTPEESGRVLDVDLDVLVASDAVPGESAYLYAGLRHGRFLANFRFIGGNEDFDVTTAEWGLGAGAESRFSLGSRTSLVITAGLDYFFPGRLTGHDTSYGPEGDDVNPRESFDYDDADDAVNQPGLRPVLLVGVRRSLGGG